MIGTATQIRPVAAPELGAVTALAIEAVADVQGLPRICGLLAQFGVIPVTLTCRQTGVLLSIDVELNSRQCDRHELLLTKIRQLVMVRRASMVTGG